MTQQHKISTLYIVCLFSSLTHCFIPHSQLNQSSFLTKTIHLWQEPPQKSIGEISMVHNWVINFNLGDFTLLQWNTE